MRLHQDHRARQADRAARHVARIFLELSDWTTWPPVPQQPLLPGDPARIRTATLADLQNRVVDPAELTPWTPSPHENAKG